MISDSQRIDYLFKKLGYGAAKTDRFDIKSPSNESIPSYLLMRGDNLWLKSDLIPTTPPTTTNNEIRIYRGTDRIECVPDITSTPNRTWKTNLKDWIPTEFGALYIINIYIDIPGAVNPSLTGTKLFPDGSGNSDFWFFDYQSGILNFSDNNLPVGLVGKSVFVEGYRYIGLKGVQNISGGGTGELPPLVTDQEITQRTEEAIRSWSPYKIFQAITSAVGLNSKPQIYCPSIFYDNLPEPSQTVLMTIITEENISFPINFNKSRGYCKILPTSDAVFKIQKNYTDIGTVTFIPSSNYGVFAVSNQTLFTTNDILTIIAPETQDLTLAGLAITLSGTRN